MKKAHVRIVLCAQTLWVLVFAASCAGVPLESEIPDLSVSALLQEAQNSYDKNNVPAAQVYYRAILNRFPGDPPSVITAEYELAHIKVKQKKWAEALPMIDAALAKFDSDSANTLPRAYYKLLLLDREKIPERFRQGEVQGP
ncbi:MAG: hypothetical protein LBR23_02715 [Spirochaetaceae bacterium]|nr:hypothetical protein [Spirochaetaceae bacterium]